MAVQFVTPVGRLVQGDVFEPQTKDNQGQPLVVKTGPNKGQQTQRYFVAIAIPKMTVSPQTGQQEPNPGFAEFYAKLQQESRAGFPQLFNAQGVCTHPRFAMKVADGDGVDNDGKSNAGKPGFAGHWIVKFSSTFAPKVLVNSQYNNDPQSIKRGYYVRVAGNAAPNIGSDVPGLYMNHEAIEFAAYGEEIRSGIDAVGAFAAAGAMALPAGASMTPPTPQGNGGMLAAPPLPGAMPGAMPQQAPAPNHAFVQNAVGTMPPAMPPAMPPVMQPTAAAQGFTLAQWRATGRTDAQLIAEGIFTQG